jgi:hypothetical protein
MAVLLFLDAVLWLKIDASKEVRRRFRLSRWVQAHKPARLNPASVSIEKITPE